MCITIYENRIEKFQEKLFNDEKSVHTIKKYVRDVKMFVDFLNSRAIDKVTTVEFKMFLEEKYAFASINSMLASVNNFLDFIGKAECKIKPIKIGRKIFLAPEKELSENEYRKLLKVAEKQENRRLSLLIQTICSTGIRVSELQYITVESLRSNRAHVSCKNKKRTIFIPNNLSKQLRDYCRINNIKNGKIFITKNGQALDRSNIWKMMKALCKTAGVSESKVFPHNLRHLFARTFYKMEKDIVYLADILGHSSINTTRIYTMESGDVHQRKINKMQLLYRSTKTT